MDIRVTLRDEGRTLAEATLNVPLANSDLQVCLMEFYEHLDWLAAGVPTKPSPCGHSVSSPPVIDSWAATQTPAELAVRLEGCDPQHAPVRLQSLINMLTTLTSS